MELVKALESMKKRVKQAVSFRRAIDALCEKMIKEKNRQLKELLKGRGSASVLENDDLNATLTTDQDGQN